MKEIKRITLLLLLLIGIASIAYAQNNSKPLVLVIHIDAMPSFSADAAKILKAYRTETLEEKGIISCKVFQRTEHMNHFTLVEQWVDQVAYDRHVSDTHTRQFRDKIQPMLGSPFDERFHTELE